MKKSVIILIAIIYIASVALVSFFGLQFKVFEEIIPVERVEITNEVADHNDTWGDYVVITQPDENGEVRYRIDYRVYPENATNTDVSFSYQAPTPGLNPGILHCRQILSRLSHQGSLYKQKRNWKPELRQTIGFCPSSGDSSVTSAYGY